jgi:hypothetical protein
MFHHPISLQKEKERRIRIIKGAKAQTKSPNFIFNRDKVKPKSMRKNPSLLTEEK